MFLSKRKIKYYIKNCRDKIARSELLVHSIGAQIHSDYACVCFHSQRIFFSLLFFFDLILAIFFIGETFFPAHVIILWLD